MSVLTASADSSASTLPSSRVGWVDGARGLAIVLMMVSHVGLFSGLTPEWFHLYVMRPVAPVFLLLLGMLWRPGWRRRHWQLVAGALVAQIFALQIGFAAPNVMPVILGVVLVLPLATRFPHAAIALCVTQLMFWPVPAWWTGYEPGFAIALALVGSMLPADGFVRGFGKLGSLLGYEAVGRAPMRWYVGHLAVLASISLLTDGPRMVLHG